MKSPSTQGLQARRFHAGVFALCIGVSMAANPGSANAGDLDIARFQATSKVDLSSRKQSDIRIDIAVRTQSKAIVTAQATLVGRTIPGKNLVFQHQFDVSDSSGGGASAYTVVPTQMGFKPTSGGIRWELWVADDDPDDDRASAITAVRY